MRQLRNGFILLLGVLFLSAWAQRTELRVRGETVTIIRDAYGVPHVFASSLYGLFYGNGYAIAQDRLWQMERYRRQARGELAEILGPSALEQDRAARIEGYTEEEMERQIQRLSAELREALSGYAEGVNAWIEEAKRAGKLPPGYAEAGIEPRPWRPTDTVAIGVMMSRRFGGLMAAGDLRNFTLLQYLRMRSKEHAETWANDLLWLQDPNSPTTVPPEDDPRKAHKVDPKRALEQFKKHAAQLPNIGLEVLLPALRMASGEAQIEFARQHGLYTHFGSYAIAIAPKKSATGNALFVGAPQMGFSIPHIAAEVHLSGAGINAQGMSFPGIPGILIGATDHIAWSFTSGIHDLADAFIEKLNPENPEQYWYKGEWRPLEKRVEVIRVKGREPIELTVYRSIHGPIVAIDKRNNVAIAWSLSFWGKELESMNAYYGILRARTVGDFERACSHIVASFNAFCATRTGDIAYFYCGRPPIRAEGVDPRLPVWGTGEYDWKGIIPFEQMPRVINPKRGFIVNWNNKPAVWWENCDTPAWGAIFRVHRLIELASRKPVLSLDDVKAMIADIAMYDEDAAKLKPVMLAIVKRHRNLTPEMQQAIRVLEAWDNSEREGSTGKVIWDAWLDATRTRLFGDDLGNFFDPNLFRMAIQPSYILYALQGNKAAVPRLYDYFNGKPKEEVLAIALGDALTQLKQQYGANMSQWRYKAPRMNWDKLPGIPYTDRGSYIQVIELSNPIVGENILPPGQSEDPTAPHFSDQRDLSSWWLFKPMQLQLTP
jgi:penicillin amidase